MQKKQISDNMLGDAAFCRTLLASILMRANIKILDFTQADFDRAAGLFLLEGEDLETGAFLITVVTKEELDARVAMKDPTIGLGAMDTEGPTQ